MGGRPVYVEVVVRGANGHHYQVHGWWKGYVKFNGQRLCWVQSQAFDHLFSRRDIVEMRKEEKAWA